MSIYYVATLGFSSYRQRLLIKRLKHMLNKYDHSKSNLPGTDIFDLKVNCPVTRNYRMGDRKIKLLEIYDSENSEELSCKFCSSLVDTKKAKGCPWYIYNYKTAKEKYVEGIKFWEKVYA